jgi:hypothetical protein
MSGEELLGEKSPDRCAGEAPARRKVVTLCYNPRGSSQPDSWSSVKMLIDDEPENMVGRVYAVTGFPEKRPLRFSADVEGELLNISVKTAFSGTEDVVYVTWTPLAPGEGAATHDIEEVTPEGGGKPTSDTGFTSPYRKGAVRTDNPNKSKRGKNPQLMKVQNEVAREAWEKVCCRAEAVGAWRRDV